MKLFIQYLHRERRESTERANWHTVVNDRQRIFDDYVFTLDFEARGITEEELKKQITEAVLANYAAHGADNLMWLAHPDPEANCISLRFEDQDENFGESVYLQSNGTGWKYYNFPPFGKKGRQIRIDPRTVIDDLLRTGNLEDYFRELKITYNDETWTFTEPCQNGVTLGAERLTIQKGDQYYFIQDPVYVFPYTNKQERDGIANEQCAAFTTLFAILLRAKTHWEGEDYNINLTLLRRYTSNNELYYVLSGDVNQDEFEDESTEREEIINYTGGCYLHGEFCSNRIKKDKINHLNMLDALNIYPLYARSEEYSGGVPAENLFSISSDIEKLQDPDAEMRKDYIITTSINGDTDEFDGKWYNITLQHAKENAFRTYMGVRSFEEALFDGKEITDCDLRYSEINTDGYFSWVVGYETEHTVLTVSFVANRFLVGGVYVKHVELATKVGKGAEDKDYLIHAEYELGEEFDILQAEAFLKDNADENILPDNCIKILEEAENLLTVFEYFDNGLYKWILSNIKKYRLGYSVLDKSDEEDSESEEEKAVETDAAEKLEAKAEKRNNKYEILRAALRAEKGKTLSYSDGTLHEIAVCLTDWLPIIAKANEEGKNVRSYLLDNDEMEAPYVPNIAIIGEAGTGKTTLAKKLATSCIGAGFMMIVGNELGGLYKNWTKVAIARKIMELQAELPENVPAVLFIDEAYLLFEGSREDSSSGKIIELLLKLAEPEEYVIDLSEVYYKERQALGLEFHRDSKDGFEDTELYDVTEERNGYNIVIKKIRKRKNTVIWLGGYEDRLRKSFLANEGLQRRFLKKISIPTPKMSELITKFKEGFIGELKQLNGEDGPSVKISGRTEKTVKNFLTWATSRSRSHLFGNYAGKDELIQRCLSEYKICEDVEQAVEEAVKSYKNELEKQYKAELKKDIDVVPFEVVTEVDETLDDYAGNDRLRSRIEGIIDIMLKKEEYEKKNISLPKGALLMGPPGTGKTMLAKCMAGELAKRINEEALEKNQKDVAFIPTTGAELLSCPNPSKAISALFSEAAAYDAAVIFIDEIDSIGKDRRLQHNIGPLTQLMKEMDGFSSGGTVFVMAATNDPDSLDPALVRDNRFDIRLEVGWPDRKTSIALLKHYLPAYGIDFDQLEGQQKDRLMRYLGGTVPASVKANLNEAAILYHRCEQILINYSEEVIRENFDLELAHRRNGEGGYFKTKNYKGKISDFDLFLLDLKESIDIKEIGMRNEVREEEEFSTDTDAIGGPSFIAIHEVGHAIAGLANNCLNIERITILGRGSIAGYVEHKRNSGNPVTKRDYINRIITCMGGRVAEEMIYGPEYISRGASQDIQDASDYAREMVTQYGFSDEIGFMAVGQLSEGYLGNEFSYLVGEDIRNLAEAEQSRILKECMEETRNILSENKEILLSIAETLFERKEIFGEEMEKIYKEMKK